MGGADGGDSGFCVNTMNQATPRYLYIDVLFMYQILVAKLPDLAPRTPGRDKSGPYGRGIASLAG